MREGKEILYLSRSLFFSMVELAVSGDISEFSPELLIPPETVVGKVAV